MTSVQTRSGVSVEELQAAYEAARRGEFSGTGAGPRRGGQQDRGTGSWQGSGWRPAGPVIAVFAAHAGAGASIVALAVAEALSERAMPVRVVEMCDPARSGLAAATTAELGEDGSGWQRGRRGDMTLDRLTDRPTSAQQVPPPRPAGTTGAGEVLVLDVGWSARDAYRAGGWLGQALQDAAVLLVCRPTVPGARQAEHLAAELAAHAARPVVLAAVGPTRWPGAVTASSGPQLRGARSDGRVVPVPIDRRLEVGGVSGEPLPKPMSAAGRAIAAALPASQPQTSRHRAGLAESEGRNHT
jgi:hypothetical protein